MRNLLFLLTVVFIHFTIFTRAQRVYKAPEPEPETRPDVVTPKIPAGEHDDANTEAPGVPGALATGENPKPAPEDEEPDWNEIADALKDLIEKIVDALEDSTSGGSSSSSGGVATISSPPRTALPIRASPCASALDAFSTCSSAYNGTFSAVATTVQAGCLCNAAPTFDFNGQMRYCHSYVQDHTQLQSYASAIANATAVCGCDSAPSSILGIEVGGCTTSTASPGAATSSSSSLPQAGSEATLSPSTPSPTGTSGAVRIGCASFGAVAAAVMLGFVSLLL